MRQSKLFTAVITLALLGAMVVGCGGEPKEALPTVDEVVANSVAALEELTTWCCEQSMYMDIEVSGREEGHVTVLSRQKGTIDLPDREMESDMTTSAVSFGKETETRQTVYFVEGTVYMRTDTPDMGEQWMEQTLSGTQVDLVWETLTRALAASADMLEACHFEQLSLGEVGGVPCYLLEGSIDEQEFSKLFQQITGSTQALPLDVSEMFQDCEVSFWVARDTYNLVQQKMTATISMEIEGVKIEGDMEGTSRYYDHGKEVSIELPPAAVEALAAPGVTFPDLNLEAAIRNALSKPEGEKITADELTELTVLKANYSSIADLSGLEYCTNMTHLDLRGNQISDITPLSNLTSLTDLYLGANQISDLTPLASLTNLTKLRLDINRISDITPLASLSNLTLLGLRGNQISDITPLVENSGLGAEDEIWLEGNNLDLGEGSDDMENIKALEDRGVEVIYE